MEPKGSLLCSQEPTQSETVHIQSLLTVQTPNYN